VQGNSLQRLRFKLNEEALQMIALLLSILLTKDAPPSHSIINPCNAPRPIGDAAGFYAIEDRAVRRKDPKAAESSMAEIQMMSRLIDTRRSATIGWMYVDQRGKRWIQLAAGAGEGVHRLFNARYVPSRPGYDYQTVYPFSKPELPSEIRSESCETK
jgi:hypothetical protein